MPETPSEEPQRISVAEAKRHFADVLGSVRHRGERYIVERNGTPMAALVPVEYLSSRASSERRGFLALVGKFDDAPEFAAALAGAVRSRRAQRSGPAPRLAR